MRCLMFGLAGYGTYVEDWAVAASRSAEIVGITSLATFPPHGRRVGRRMTMGRIAGFPVVFVKTPIRIRPKRLSRAINNRLEIARLLPAIQLLEREHGPVDILHSHFYAGSGPIPRLAATLGIPFVHTEHSSRLVADPRFASVSRRAMREIFGQAAAVMFVSRAQMEFVRSLGIDGRFRVVPNPVDPRLFRVGKGGYPDEIRLITVGNLIPGKRHKLMLEALAIARTRDSRLRLDMVGSGESQSDLELQSAQLGLSGSVNFWGRVDRTTVAELLARSDIYVHASHTETFGVAIVEALFSGLPVIVAAAGGVTNDIPTTFGSTLTKPDPATFASAIIDIAARLSTFEREAIAGQARGMFSFDAVAGTLGRIYEEAIAGEGPR